LPEAESQFHTIFELAPIGIKQVMPDGKLISANLALQHFLGYTEREMCDRSFTELIHPEDVAPSLELIRRLIAGEIDRETIEKRYIRKDGRVVWGHTMVSAVRKKSGDVYYFITMVEDITAWKRAEELSNVTHTLLLSVSRERRLPQVLQRYLEAALKVSEMDCGGIYLIDDVGGLNLEHAVGLSERFIEGARYYPPDAANTRLVRAGEPVYSRHADLDKSISGEDRGEVLKAFASIPIYDESGLIGCMNVASHRIEEVPNDSRLFLEKIAYVAGLLIGHARVEAMQRQSEERLRSIFNNSPDGILFTSPDGSIFAANPAACRMLGRTEKEICDGGRDVVVNEADPRLLKSLEKRRTTGKFMGEISHKRKDGSTFPVEISSTTFKSARGETRSCVIFRDITERKKIEKELISREREYRTLIENLPDFVVRYDLNLRRIYVNPAWQKASGLSAAEVIDVPIADVKRVPIPAPKEYEQKLRQVLESGISQTMEFSWINASGENLFLEYVIVPEYDHDDKITGLLAVGRDMTRQIRLKKELEDSAAQLETVYESLDEAVFVIEPGTRIILTCNAAAEKVFGHTREEMIGRTTEHLHVNRKTYIEFGEKFNTALTSKGVFNTEYHARKKDGTIILTEHTVKEVRDDSGSRTMLIIVVRDITNRKKTLEMLKQREEELGIKNTHLEEMNTTLNVLLDQRESEKKRLEENFSESINSIIIPYLDRIRKTDLSALQKEYIDTLESNLREIIRPYRHRVSDKLLKLSPSEVLVMNHIKQGYSSKEIASLLNLSIRTIGYHRDNIRKKLDIKDRNINLRTYLYNALP